MNLRRTNYRALLLATYLLGGATVTSTAADYATFGFESAGARLGFGASNTSDEIWQSEAFLNFSLPSDWNLGKGWRTWLRLDASAGWLGEKHHGGFSASLGPTLVLGRPPLPLTVEAGASPGVIAEHEFQYKNLGSPFQIVSHVGLNYDLLHSFRLSYRFQHLSNGGVAAPNPGLNLHFVSISWVF